jgi:hypothetical protein
METSKMDISVTEARNHLSHWLKQIEKGGIECIMSNLLRMELQYETNPLNPGKRLDRRHRRQ